MTTLACPRIMVGPVHEISDRRTTAISRRILNETATSESEFH